MVSVDLHHWHGRGWVRGSVLGAASVDRLRGWLAGVPRGADVGAVGDGPRLRAVFAADRLTGEASLLLGRPAMLGGVVAPTPAEGIDVPEGRLAALLALGAADAGTATVVELDGADDVDGADDGGSGTVRLPPGAVLWVRGGRSGTWTPTDADSPVFVAAYGPAERPVAAGGRPLERATG